MNSNEPLTFSVPNTLSGYPQILMVLILFLVVGPLLGVLVGAPVLVLLAAGAILCPILCWGINKTSRPRDKSDEYLVYSDKIVRKVYTTQRRIYREVTIFTKAVFYLEYINRRFKVLIIIRYHDTRDGEDYRVNFVSPTTIMGCNREDWHRFFKEIRERLPAGTRVLFNSTFNKKE